MAYYTNLSTVLCFLENTINKNIILSNLYKIWLWNVYKIFECT